MSSIVVVGSVNMDIVNAVEKHVQPGETIHGYGTAYSPGGKGANQAVAASLSGADVAMIAAVGTDGFGTELLGALTKYGVRTSSVCRKDGSSGLAFIMVDAKGQNSIILSSGANGQLTVGDVAAAEAELSHADAVLLQNEIPWAVTQHVIEYTHAKGIVSIVNPAPAVRISQEVLGLIHTLVLNETEAEAVSGQSVGNMEQAEHVAKGLLACGVQAVIITLGERGSIYVDGAATIRTPIFPVKPVDTTAAGDTFIGAYAASVTAGMPVEEALRFASAAAAIAVTREGAQASVPSREEVAEFLRRQTTG